MSAAGDPGPPLPEPARGSHAAAAEARAPSSGLAPVPAPAAREVAGLLASALVRGAGDLALVLEPADLGPLHFTIETADGRLSVTVTAERAETLELMRRHPETLAEAFRAAGFGSVDMSFGRHPGQEAADPAPPGATTTAPVAASPPPGPPPPAAGRLDLRL
jgi:hypothetical protein